MSCNDCVFLDGQAHDRVAIPCNSCLNDSSDKGFCVASRSIAGYVPIVTKIREHAHAMEIMERARLNGTELELFQWSKEKGAFYPATC
ncbi:MAG: hypothetical protein P8171_23385 [Candidatus Thiodiazotropha sp.]